MQGRTDSRVHVLWARLPQMVGIQIAEFRALIRANVECAEFGRVTTRREVGVPSVFDGRVGAGCEVEVFGGFGQVEGGQDGLVATGEGRALGDAALGGGQGDQVHAVQFVAQVAPGVTGAGFGDPDKKQCQPTQLDVGKCIK
jgi:hypothetical protein